MSIKHIIRNTDIQTYLGCEWKFDFSSDLRMGYKPLVPAEELDFGTAWHLAMEVYYDPDELKNQQRTLDVFLKKNREQQLLAREYGRNPEDRSSEREPSLVEQVELGKGMLAHYFDWAAIHDDFEPVMVETEFEVPILNPETSEAVFCGMSRSIECSEHPYPMQLFNEDCAWIFKGRVDGIRKRNDGTYWLAEEKTATNETDWSWHVFEPQTSRYMWALRHSLGIDLRGVIRTEALKRYPKPPKPLKSGGFSVDRQQPTTTKLFLNALADHGELVEDNEKYYNYLLFLQSPSAPVFIRREYVDFTPEMLKITGENLFKIAKRMITADNEDLVPNVTFMCKRCAFFIPCLGRQSGDDFMYSLNTQFKKEVRS
jgi:hypothetical protein